MYTIWIQVNIFVIMFLWGMIMGIIFDTYRLLFPTSRIKGIVQYIADLLFWLIVTTTTFTIFMLTNLGQVRLYLLFAICFGFIIYLVILSRTTIRLINRIKTLLYNFLNGVFNLLRSFVKLILKIVLILLMPVRYLLSIVFKPIIKLKNKIINIIRRK